MNAWVQSQSWAHGPRSLLVIAALVLGPLDVVAIKRGMGARTYLRMPLHAFGVMLLGVLVQAGLGRVLPAAAAGYLTTFIAVPAIAFLVAFYWYRPGGLAGDVLKRGAIVQDGSQM